MEIKIVPGAFDNFDGTQEEMDELMAEIQRMVDSGELFENAVPMTDEEFDALPDEVKEQLMQELSDEDTQETAVPVNPGRLLH